MSAAAGAGEDAFAGETPVRFVRLHSCVGYGNLGLGGMARGRLYILIWRDWKGTCGLEATGLPEVLQYVAKRSLVLPEKLYCYSYKTELTRGSRWNINTRVHLAKAGLVSQATLVGAEQ